ncbi:multiple sugar transport system permease protein [Paenibacillus sp. 1_12]|uniref:carbohydrate ABC transporter permease n=1 Tax=Paenibacillus sp. 1_12 TaxID=1566278 RepID=UPI0008DF5DA7|nr:carbohydrate ABC transporter permease [Paenibacillus sp. 1_12]SFM38881.1 multiple sugar transport system permease protein [Paenibacillus sp. 1_12]
MNMTGYKAIRVTEGAVRARRVSWGKHSLRAVLYLILMAGSVAMIVPFLWMISTSLKSSNEMYMFPPIWIPKQILWANYSYMFQNAPWGLYFFNTVKITLFVIIGQLVTSSMGAYAFARLRFPGRDAMFLMFLGTMMIPYQVTMIPIFKIIKLLGWLDTHYALIIPGLFSAFGTFLLRQFMLTIPKELEQSAMIDGCGYPRIFWHVILPNTKPALTTLAIFAFMGTWNDFLAPLIYINSDQLKTLSLGLATFQGTYTNQWSYLMAGAVIVTMPVLIMYACAQRYFVEGITMTGLKE